jgi:hypothetical protein
LKKSLLRIIAAVAILSALPALSGCDISRFGSKDTGSSAAVKYKANGSGYGFYRFKGTSGVLTYTVPDDYEGKPVTALLEFSFANAEYLEELTIGPNISSIDVWALTNCPKLKSIKVSKENNSFADVDGVLYTKNMETLVAFPNMNTTALTIPDGVKEIAANAFYKCDNLKTVKFPAGLKTVSDRAFLKCTALEAADLPDGLEKIGNDSFSYCHAMTDIFVPASVTSIGDYAFFDATKVPAIKMGRSGEDGMTFGRDWKYKKDAKFNSDIPVEWGASR